MNISIADRFGQAVQPKEWFLVPLVVIDEVVEMIKSGEIQDVFYDPDSATLVHSANV